MAREVILVVDDSEDQRVFIRRSLESKGYVCHMAADGQEALDILASTTIDLALVDVMMPNVSGLTLFDRIRERGLDVAVIFVTAMDDLDIAVEQMKLGAYDFITKPVTAALQRRAFPPGAGASFSREGEVGDGESVDAGGGGMQWGEAFRKASYCIRSVFVWALLAEVIVVAGACLLGWGLRDHEARGHAIYLGGGLMAWGGVMTVVIGVAVWIKVSTDSVAEHVVRRAMASRGRHLRGQRARDQGPAR